MRYLQSDLRTQLSAADIHKKLIIYKLFGGKDAHLLVWDARAKKFSTVIYTVSAMKHLLYTSD